MHDTYLLTYLLTYLFDNRSVLRHTFWSTRYSVCALSSFLAQLSSPFSVATAVYVILGKIDSANCSRAAEHLRARTARPPSQPRATFTPLTSLSDNIPSFRIYAEVWLPAFSAKNIGLWRVETHQSIIDEWSYGFMGLHYGPPHPWKENMSSTRHHQFVPEYELYIFFSREMPGLQKYVAERTNVK